MRLRIACLLLALSLAGCSGGFSTNGELGDGKLQLSDLITILAMTQGGGGAGQLVGLLGGGGFPGLTPSDPVTTARNALCNENSLTLAQAKAIGLANLESICAALGKTSPVPPGPAAFPLIIR